MQIIEFIPFYVGGAFIAFLLIFVFVKFSSPKKEQLSRSKYEGPSNLHFDCAGCSEQFAHTKRTIAAWQKGTRRFFCNKCHKKWRESTPPQESKTIDPIVVPREKPESITASPVMAKSFSKSSSQTHYSSTESRSGCLGVVLLCIIVPPVIFLVSKYS